MGMMNQDYGKKWGKQYILLSLSLFLSLSSLIVNRVQMTHVLQIYFFVIRLETRVTWIEGMMSVVRKSLCL